MDASPTNARRTTSTGNMGTCNDAEPRQRRTAEEGGCHGVTRNKNEARIPSRQFHHGRHQGLAKQMVRTRTRQDSLSKRSSSTHEDETLEGQDQVGQEIGTKDQAVQTRDCKPTKETIVTPQRDDDDQTAIRPLAWRAEEPRPRNTVCT